MPKKPEITHNQAVNLNFKDILAVVDIKDIKFLEDLVGEERISLAKFCHETYNNPLFIQIVKNFVFTQVMFTADAAVNFEQYLTGKMMVQGIKAFEDLFHRWAAEYENMREPTDNFNPRASFPKPKIN